MDEKTMNELHETASKAVEALLLALVQEDDADAAVVTNARAADDGWGGVDMKYKTVQGEEKTAYLPNSLEKMLGLE